jgi:hypothetical protein
VGIVAALNVKTNEAAALLSNFEDSKSRYIVEMKNLPCEELLYCSEYMIDESRALEWDREQVLSSGDFRIVVELPKESVRLLLFTPKSQKNNSMDMDWKQ